MMLLFNNYTFTLNEENIKCLNMILPLGDVQQVIACLVQLMFSVAYLFLLVLTKLAGREGVCLAFADEVLCWLYGTVKESEFLTFILALALGLVCHYHLVAEITESKREKTESYDKLLNPLYLSKKERKLSILHTMIEMTVHVY
jgi:hypothetical protein